MLKKIALALLLCSAAAGYAKDTTTRQNYRLTRDYYARLVAGPTPNIVELNMLMTMLPKGGDLHHHYSGSIYVEHFLDAVQKAGYCIYRENDAENKIEKFRIESRTAPGAALPKNCLTVEQVYRDNNFYRELLKTWSDKDFDNHSHEQQAPDQHFFNTFGYFGPVSAYETNQSLQQLKVRAKAENLQYLETMLKSAPDVPNPALAAKIDSLAPDAGEAEVNAALAPYADFMVQDAGAKARIADYVAMLAEDAANIDDADFTLRFQTYVSRNSQPSRVFSSMVASFLAAQQSKQLVGVNIVGPENGRIAIRDYKLHMRMFGFLHQRYPDVQLALHAGELTLGMVPPEELRSHIRDAVQIAGAGRIGHGTDVAYEDAPDELLKLLRTRQIPVEINLSSGAFILGVKNEAHPVGLYLRHGVPIVISSDDTGVSRNNLSGEYVLFASRYKPSYDSLKKIVANSISFSFLTPTEKREQLRLLEQRFRQFEARVAGLAKSVKSN